jgi:3-ketosteroid 9alpha-monooxygenase subunit B
VTQTPAPGGSRHLTVARIVPESGDAVSIVFAVPPEDRAAFNYRPGQFLTLRIPSDRTGSVARCYSIASSPHTDDELTVTVKRTADGYGSNWLCDNGVPGLRLQVLPPAGAFVPKSLDGDFLLLAAGSGITPIMSILKSTLARGNGQVTLVYANRDEASVIFAAGLRALASSYPDRLTVVHWLESVQGLPRPEQLGRLAAPYTAGSVFVCGPKPFMAVVASALTSLGVPRDRIHRELFLSLSGDPFAEVSAPIEAPVEPGPIAPGPIDVGPIDADGPVPATTADAVTARVRLQGATHELSWPIDTSLTETLLAAGIEAPYSCREGECGTCTAQLTSGKVRMLNNEVLEEEDIADGYILTCQAVPDGSDVEVQF